MGQVVAFFAVLLALAFPLTGEAQERAPLFKPKYDVPYVATSERTVAAMLRLGKASPGDILYDLGSGDGRIVIAGVRDFKVKHGVGIEISPRWVAASKANAAAAGVQHRTRFVEANVFEANFSEATLVTMYLFPDVNLKLRPKILDMKPGTRIVSHAFDMGDWKPDRHEVIGETDLYLWIVPAKVAGTWTWEENGTDYRLTVSQTFSTVSGTLIADGRASHIADGKVTGMHMALKGGFSFDGDVHGGTMEGVIRRNGRTHKITARRALSSQ